MFIKKLHVESFRGLNDVQVIFGRPRYNYFQNVNISVLVGENGTGKSSILQLLIYAFSPSRKQAQILEKLRFSIDFELDEEDFIYENIYVYSNRYPSKVIVSSFSVFDPYMPRTAGTKIRIGRSIEEAEYVTRYVYCGPSEGGFSTIEPVIHPILQALFIPDTDEKKIKCYNNLLHTIGCKKVNGFLVHRDRLERLQKIAEDEIDNDEDKIVVYEYYRRLIELRNKNRNKNRDEFPKRNPSYFGIYEDQFGTEILDLYNLITELHIDSCIRDVVFENEAGNMVLLSEMSSGEVTMLFRFLPLLIEMEDNALVLIDEPETHLHPSWASEFIWRLTELFQNYKLHIILATHSPIIASDVPMECIVGLKKTEGYIQQYKPKDRTLGGYPSELLRDVFNLNQLTGNFAIQKIKRIIKLLENNNPSSQQISEAREIYNDLSTTIEKYNLYQRFKNYFKE